MKEITPHSSSSRARLSSSLPHSKVDIPKGLPGALRTLYKAMMRKSNDYTIYMPLDKYVELMNIIYMWPKRMWFKFQIWKRLALRVLDCTSSK